MKEFDDPVDFGEWRGIPRGGELVAVVEVAGDEGSYKGCVNGASTVVRGSNSGRTCMKRTVSCSNFAPVRDVACTIP